ncbi:MAG: hypothetical protein ABSG21_01840 [Spirochaetia bacterium]|jgi:flagellar motor component MotA
MLFDPVYFERARCTDKEREELVALALRIVGLSVKAHKDGLLALEDAAGPGDPFLAYGLELVVSGTSSEYVRETLCTLMLAGDLKGKGFLARMIETDGLLGIQEGSNSEMLERKLLAYLGERIFFSPRAAKK